MCHREKSQVILASDIASGTPSSTKTMGELAVILSEASDGKISDMGFSCAHGL
jgi:hypothetical protein